MSSDWPGEVVVSTESSSHRRERRADEALVRQRILSAAFSAFMAGGYAQTSTREIATRAHVSKRELYSLVGNKQEMLAACIGERANRLQVPAGLPEPRDRASLERVLSTFGALVLREASDPTVIAVFRLAIAEAVHAPEVAQALHSLARLPSRAALVEILTRAQASGFVAGRPDEMAERFSGLLWGDLMLGLLLRVAEQPNPAEFTQRADAAAAAFLRLYPSPEGS
jgi:AcrR family transcriptional regulator